MALAMTANDPLDRAKSILRGGEAISGKQALSRPVKQTPNNGPEQLGERNPLKPPFTEVFDDYPQGAEFDQFERYFQAINSDGDTNPSGSDRTWGYYNYNGESNGRKFSKCAYLQYPLEVAKCDDWLIPRAIKFEAGKYYRITVDASLYLQGAVHTFEVKMGEYNDAEGLNIPVIPATDVESIIPQQYDGWFVPEYDGIYYMGIHGISDRQRSEGGYLFMDNITVELGRNGREPSVVENLEFVNDPDGASTTSISFTAPEKAINGETISGQVAIKVKRDGNIIRSYEVAPGTVLSFEDQVATAGNYTYTFTCSNDEGQGCDLRVSRFVGMSTPLPPVVTSFTEPTEGSVCLRWEAPATDVNGTAINPDKLRYNLYNVTYEGLWPVAEDFAGTEYSQDLNILPGTQEVTSMVITAVINEMESTGVQTEILFVGEPHGIPYENHFCDNDADIILAAEGDEGIIWRMLDDFSNPKSQDGDGGYICMIGTQPGQYGELSTGKISLAGSEDPFVSFYTYVYDDDENEVSVIAVDCATGERTVLKTFALNTLNSIGWTRVVCPLKGFGGKTIRLVTGVKIQSHGYTPIDNMRVDRMPAIDLAVDRVEYDRHAGSSAPFDVWATVSNIGAQTAESYTVRLKEGDRVLNEVTAGPLESFGSEVVNLTGRFEATSAEVSTFTVDVVGAGDNNDSNNESPAFSITYLAPNYPVVDDLKGEESEGQVHLTWGAPDLSKAAPEETLEDFERYPAFTTELEGFTMVDADGGNVVGLRGLEMPVNGTSQAYWTMRAEEPTAFLYTNGVSSLFAMATVDENKRPIANDDWLISPELYGGRQTISFLACSQTIDYGNETFEVYASDKTADLSDFRLVMVETEVGEDFEKFYVTLPAGTKYFAIRCTSNDRYFFTLDDIRYTAPGEPAPLIIKGYNVYRNGEKLNTELLSTPGYTAAREREGDDFFVTTVYDKGESTASNVVRIGTDGVGSIDAEQAPAEYYDMHGFRVNATELAPGVYVRRQGSSATKIIVK